jgi:hypothetical protein
VTLPLQIRLNGYKPYGAGAVAKIIEPSCVDRSPV